VTQAVQHLVELVRRASVNPMGRDDVPSAIIHESRVADYLEAQLTHPGVDCRRVDVAPGRPSVIATFTPTNATGHVLFEAHTDTVPVDAMTIDPFAATIEKCRLYGRGACDVKAGVAAMLTAFLRYASSYVANGPKLTAAFTIDEEHTFLGVQHLALLNLDVDFAVVAEPTKLAIVGYHKGVTRWTTTVRGVACHSSEPGRGVNAIERMMAVLNAIQHYSATLANTTHATLGPATLVVGVIHGGTAANIVPEACTIEIDRRLLPGETAASAFSAYEAMLVESHFPFGIENEMTFACPPLAAVDPANPWLRRLQSTIATVTGCGEITGVPFATNASTLAAAGIPSVVFGPGDIAQAHTHDEWVEVAQVDAAAEILYRFLTSTSTGAVT
jgi:acetylornithine deacetylase